MEPRSGRMATHRADDVMSRVEGKAARLGQPTAPLNKRSISFGYRQHHCLSPRPQEMPAPETKAAREWLRPPPHGTAATDLTGWVSAHLEPLGGNRPYRWTNVPDLRAIRDAPAPSFRLPR